MGRRAEEDHAFSSRGRVSALGNSELKAGRRSGILILDFQITRLTRDDCA